MPGADAKVGGNTAIAWTWRTRAHDRNLITGASLPGQRLQRRLARPARRRRARQPPHPDRTVMEPAAGPSGHEDVVLWRRADGFSALRANAATGRANPGARQATPLRRLVPRSPAGTSRPGVGASSRGCTMRHVCSTPSSRVKSWHPPAGRHPEAARRAPAHPQAPRRRRARGRPSWSSTRRRAASPAPQIGAGIGIDPQNELVGMRRNAARTPTGRPLEDNSHLGRSRLKRLSGPDEERHA